MRRTLRSSARLRSRTDGLRSPQGEEFDALAGGADDRARQLGEVELARLRGMSDAGKCSPRYGSSRGHRPRRRPRRAHRGGSGRSVTRSNPVSSLSPRAVSSRSASTSRAPRDPVDQCVQRRRRRSRRRREHGLQLDDDRCRPPRCTMASKERLPTVRPNGFISTSELTQSAEIAVERDSRHVDERSTEHRRSRSRADSHSCRLRLRREAERVQSHEPAMRLNGPGVRIGSRAHSSRRFSSSTAKP